MSKDQSAAASESQLVEDFLSAHPGLDIVEVMLPDLNGRLRGKWIAPSCLKKAFTGGLKLPVSTLAFDVWGRDPEGWVLDDGDVDGVCRPDVRSLKAVPWLERPTAQLLLSLDDVSGNPCACDPRALLQRIAGRLGKLGLVPVPASEMEFYLFRDECDRFGRPLHTQIGPAGSAAIGGETYSIEAMESVAAFMHAVRDACKVQGLPVDTLIAEAAPSQYEINLFHQPDALLAADHSVLLQRAIKGVARKHGMRASFMAKPFADLAGNGMHVHCSVLDSAGSNAFDNGTDEGAQLLQAAIAGCLAYLPDCMLLFAPNRNSYRRFQQGSHAPMTASWGYDNRTVALRVPAGPHKAMRIEHRVAGADANPYLVMAALLAGITAGIEQDLSPPSPVDGDAATQELPSLPATWAEALRTFSDSAFIREYLGGEFQEIYAGIKQQEIEEFARHIDVLEYHSYL
ncbi:MAG: glutamine synthetase [Halioglobus sp.]|nr:glutamine synthetase [Halioglobus sp.]